MSTTTTPPARPFRTSRAAKPECRGLIFHGLPAAGALAMFHR